VPNYSAAAGAAMPTTTRMRKAEYCREEIVRSRTSSVKL